MSSASYALSDAFKGLPNFILKFMHPSFSKVPEFFWLCLGKLASFLIYCNSSRIFCPFLCSLLSFLTIFPAPAVFVIFLLGGPARRAYWAFVFSILHFAVLIKLYLGLQCQLSCWNMHITPKQQMTPCPINPLHYLSPFL